MTLKKEVHMITLLNQQTKPVDKVASTFSLDETFLLPYRTRKPEFAFNGLGEFTYFRTYSRIKPGGGRETWFDTVRRVVEGCYEIQRRHCINAHVPWNRKKAQLSAQEMYERIWSFKFTPPGRGLWTMGTEFMFRAGGACLNNCGFVSTKRIATKPTEPFCFMLDMSMLGVGVGFDTKGAGRLQIKKPQGSYNYIIPDSREGWTESLKLLIEAYVYGTALPSYDYSQLREAGTPIKGFGGVAAGPDPLRKMHEWLVLLFEKCTGSALTSVDITDAMNIIGACVVAGNVRRSSEIALGELDDEAYMQMKDYRQYPQECKDYRWASNNSIFAKCGMDYRGVAKQVGIGGEPGLFWLDLVRKYGRMKDAPNNKDRRVEGTNPCAEQSLESFELCTLVETFPARHEDAKDYFRTLKFAYLYAKTVTLLPTHNANTNRVMMRNRRIGLSQSGIVQAFEKFGRTRMLQEFCDKGYEEIQRWDEIYSGWLCIPRSVKTTSVKPSGTVSLLAGATPGIHYPIALTHWRRVRVASNSEYIPLLKEAGYHIEPSVTDPSTSVVTFGVLGDEYKGLRTEGEVSVWEQTKNAVAYNREWADNQVSVTIKFRPSEAKELVHVLEAYDGQLKSVSFLPLEDHGYAQAPYEAATPEEIIAYNAKIKPINYALISEGPLGERFCDGDKCTIITAPQSE